MRALIAILLLVTLTACQLQRPGEIAPREVPGCDQIESLSDTVDLESLTAEQRELLIYCKTAAATEAAKATATHTDFVADMSYLSVVLSAGAMIAAIMLQMDS
ncbi:MAG TPA: hypothetical protein VF178_08455 [Gemmatimonadaceae bacterium]